MDTVATVSSFEDFYRSEFRSTVSLAAWLTRDAATGEDLAQEVMTVIQRTWTHVRELDNPKAYLRRLVINRAANERRRKGRERRALERIAATGPASQRMAADSSDDALWIEVRRLPLRQRATVALRYLEDLSTDEIAEVLDCAPSTVRVNLHRAHRRLAEQLGRTTDTPQHSGGE